MSAYEFTGEHRKSPVVFARLLKLWDTAPESFSQWEARQVFWRFKWVTTSLLQVPEMPLASVRTWIEQMRSRYEAAQHGMQPVAAMRYHVAHHTSTGVADAYDLWATRPRTELSDCEACETRHFAWHQVVAGDDTGALDTWRPVFDGAQACTEEPQVSQARALLPLLRLGRTDEARSHHLTGCRRVRGHTGMQEVVGLHLEFCALSRNEGCGLEILAENRPLFEATGAPLAHLEFLTGVEVLLALVEDGHADTPVAGPPGRNWTAGALLAHVRSEADRLSAAFDARNGTTTVGDRRRLRLARRPLLDEPLPLGLRTSATRSPQPAGTAAGAGAAGSLGAATAGPEVPDDFFSLVSEARRMARLGHPGDTRLWTHIAERVADGGTAHDDRLGPEDLLRAELAEQRAYLLLQEDRHAESIADLELAAGLFERLAMPWQALSTRTRALAWATTPDAAADLGRTEGDDDHADGVSPRVGTDADGGSLRVDTKADGGSPLVSTKADAFRASLDACLREAERLSTGAPFTGEPQPLGDGRGRRLRRPRLGARAGVPDRAVLLSLRRLPGPPATAPGSPPTRCGSGSRSRPSGCGPRRNACPCATTWPTHASSSPTSPLSAATRSWPRRSYARLWRTSTPPGGPGAVRARALLAQILLAEQAPAEATELLHRAIADAVRYGDTDFPLAPTYALLGHASTHLGDSAGAVRHLSEAAARFDQDGTHDEAAQVRLQLADVLANTGQQADAVAVLESVLTDEAASSLDERLVAQARLTLARGMRELDEFLASAEEFLRLADTVAAWEDDRTTHTMVAAEAATTLAMADRWEAAGTPYERAVAAHAEAPHPPLIIHMMREFARLTVSVREEDGVDRGPAAPCGRRRGRRRGPGRHRGLPLLVRERRDPLPTCPSPRPGGTLRGGPDRGAGRRRLVRTGRAAGRDTARRGGQVRGPGRGQRPGRLQGGRRPPHDGGVPLPRGGPHGGRRDPGRAA
ncbi:tetratricopeptide repeat protein [Streptomyces sp. SBC-4]|nr:tetratricopeptide repeat protein [Streptomyces sp. SBC-4]MDV5143108.1 tetratricopeptide repeat protein [Streptomyces sp. SBC-4]